MELTVKNKYFGTWPFYKRLLFVALPVMAQQLIQNLVSLIDNFMVSGLGDIKMSGENIAGSVMFLFIVLLNTLCSSGGIFMSQFRGASSKEGMEQTFRFKILVTGICGILFAFFCFCAPRKVFYLMLTKNTDADAILDQAQIYSRAVALSWIFAVFSQSIASSLREIEILKAPLIISVSATLINTFFNWILIYGNLGAPRLEVAGAGYATVIARFVELVIFVVYLLKKKPPFIFKFSRIFKVELKLFGKIFRKSIVILYSELFWAASETLSNALYNTRGGAEVVSGMAAGFAVCNLIFIAMGGVYTATQVVMGQELGADHIEESRVYKNWILTGSLIFGFFFLALGLSLIPVIPLVFRKLSSGAIRIAIHLLIVCAVYLPLWAFMNAQYSLSRAGGDTKMGAVCDTVGNVFFIGGMLLLTFCTNFGPILMYAIVKLSDVPKTIIAHFWLKKEKWLVNLTEKK